MGAAPDLCGGMDESHLMGALGEPKCWPPGFRFHPTDEELVVFYLKRKICRRRIPSMIGEVDVYKHEPWELPEKSVLRSGDKQWYFFSPRDRKYPNGSRSNRATMRGYWKATGKDRTISQHSKPVGNKKTLVYYQGRAPRGQRTDWVMHEYTVEEQALVNCSNVQDSYALYKVFRKSGPGPKNGEQYGAPFIEEEWNDDETADDCLKNDRERESPMLEHPNCDSMQAVGGNVLPIDDLEDLLLQMSNQPDTIPQQYEVSAYASEVDVETEAGSCIVEQSQTIPFSVVETDAWCEPSILEESFQIAESASRCYQPTELPEVLSFAHSSDQGQLQAIEEFLEINDINNSDSINHTADSNGNQGPVHDINELYDPDEYFDASMFLAEAMTPLDGVPSTTTYPYFVGFEDETQFQAPHITSELWAHEQNFSVSTSMEPNWVVMESPTSGALYSSTVSNSNEQPLGQVTHGKGASVSWFSSKISTFLDSVPSSPALASENTLINRALERMSSFGAVQSRILEQNAQTGFVGQIHFFLVGAVLLMQQWIDHLTPSVVSKSTYLDINPSPVTPKAESRVFEGPIRDDSQPPLINDERTGDFFLHNYDAVVDDHDGSSTTKTDNEEEITPHHVDGYGDMESRASTSDDENTCAICFDGK
ncbi:hypothetical protein J5N97_005523 [Dioscorea zingiberensis]|uniref:NAC domain-containing protein n=1 Tax=Dioscorea zingiberensis TaxID=325984 RepID=A0A9D5HT54_9LILI|nr:hypothetical protein J5N97_005523 [Dioscorea zingiberensis]